MDIFTFYLAAFIILWTIVFSSTFYRDYKFQKQRRKENEEARKKQQEEEAKLSPEEKEERYRKYEARFKEGIKSGWILEPYLDETGRIVSFSGSYNPQGVAILKKVFKEIIDEDDQ